MPGARRAPLAPIPITARELEKCLDRLAHIIDQAGDKGVAYLPLYDRLESELQALRAEEDRMARIRARIKR